MHALFVIRHAPTLAPARLQFSCNPAALDASDSHRKLLSRIKTMARPPFLLLLVLCAVLFLPSPIRSHPPHTSPVASTGLRLWTTLAHTPSFDTLNGTHCPDIDNPPSAVPRPFPHHAIHHEITRAPRTRISHSQRSGIRCASRKRTRKPRTRPSASPAPGTRRALDVCGDCCKGGSGV